MKLPLDFCRHAGMATPPGTTPTRINFMNKPKIGFIGLGAMGGAMTVTLLTAGYQVYAFDLDAVRLSTAVDAGARAVGSIAELVALSDVIATSLPSSDAWVRVAEQKLLPCVRPGQVVIDFGTVTPPETRRLAQLFADKGVDLLDVPVSGGPGGAQSGRLYMFAGGPPATVERCRPILEAVGGTEHLTYCGPAGCGQVVKGVNQLMMGLVDAAYLEAIAFGVNAGIDAPVIAQAIGSEGRWRKDFSAIARRIAEGQGDHVGVKFRELPYFLREAEEAGFPLPLTKLLWEFCDKGERIVIDDNRPAPSFWHELTKA